MATTSSDLWIHWLKRVTDSHNRFYNDIRIVRIHLMILHRLIVDKRPLEVDQQAQIPQVLDRLIKTFSGIERFYSSVHLLAHSRTLKESLYAASAMLNQPLDIDMSPDCGEIVAHTESMSIMLIMLLESLPHRDEDHPFVEVSGTAEGYRIFIAPNRGERGAEWPDMSAPSDSWYGERPAPWLERTGDWLTAIAAELANSGYSFTVRSQRPLSTFLIEFPHKEREETAIFPRT